MKNYEITIIITFFEFHQLQFDYWLNTYRYAKKVGIPFHFIIDNPLIGNQFHEIEKTDLFINDSNIGKLDSIYNHIKSGHIKTNYFKSVDPDDYISMVQFEKLELPKDPSIVLFPMKCIESPLDNIDQSFIEKTFEETESYFQTTF